MKNKYKRQQINITQKDADIIPFLEQKSNISQYIIGLVKKDMSANSEDFKEKVIKVINNYCNGICNKSNIKNKQEDLYDSIKNVFNL